MSAYVVPWPHGNTAYQGVPYVSAAYVVAPRNPGIIGDGYSRLPGGLARRLGGLLPVSHVMVYPQS